jgi:hypothetical protein
VATASAHSVLLRIRPETVPIRRTASSARGSAEDASPAHTAPSDKDASDHPAAGSSPIVSHNVTLARRCCCAET